MSSYQAPQMMIDNNDIVEDGAWFVVAVFILLGLGATIVLGAMAWCFMYARDSFTGEWSWKDPFHVKIECN